MKAAAVETPLMYLRRMVHGLSTAASKELERIILERTLRPHESQSF